MIPIHWIMRLVEYFVLNVCRLEYNIILRLLRSVAQAWTYDTRMYQATANLINEFKNKVSRGVATPRVSRTAKTNVL